MITALRDKDLVPSLSWAYTAGARYRKMIPPNNDKLQLILSGYDKARFKENSVSFTMTEDITRDLVVVLQSISYSGSTSATLLSDPLDIFIGSTDPNLWLPEETCREFEEAFRLTLDEERQLYLVNKSHHNALLDTEAEVTFRLSDVKVGGETVGITLPYAAFDLVAENPMVKESTHCSPLKRAENSTQYTLGRVFLQEAYLSADYDQKTFNVSACVWHEGAEEDIITALSPGGEQGGGGGASGTPAQGLEKGTLAGIIVGSVLGGLLLISVAGIIILRKRRKWMRAGYTIEVPSPPPDISDMTQPVLTSAPHSTPDKSESVSATGARARASTSTGLTNSPGNSSTTRVRDLSPMIRVVSPLELDGNQTEVKRASELDRKELPLPIKGGKNREGVPVDEDANAKVQRILTTIHIPHSDQERDNGLPSTLFSTLGTTWESDDFVQGDVSPR